MTRASTGALMSVGGRWKSRGALYSTADETLWVKRMLPAGYELTVRVLTSRLAGDVIELNAQSGFSGLAYTPLKSMFVPLGDVPTFIL